MCIVSRSLLEQGRGSWLKGSNLLTNFANYMQILALINCLECEHLKQKESVEGAEKKRPHALPQRTLSSPSLSLSNLWSQCLWGSVGTYTLAPILALSFCWVKVVGKNAASVKVRGRGGENKCKSWFKSLTWKIKAVIWRCPEVTIGQGIH